MHGAKYRNTEGRKSNRGRSPFRAACRLHRLASGGKDTRTAVRAGAASRRCIPGRLANPRGGSEGGWLPSAVRPEVESMESKSNARAAFDDNATARTGGLIPYHARKLRPITYSMGGGSCGPERGPGFVKLAGTLVRATFLPHVRKQSYFCYPLRSRLSSTSCSEGGA